MHRDKATNWFQLHRIEHYVHHREYTHMLHSTSQSHLPLDTPVILLGASELDDVGPVAASIVGFFEKWLAENVDESDKEEMRYESFCD